ncbi:DNA mismatch repair protein MutL [Pseudobythopirellula maris]|uniref:DNA mismatch repair protein MutL n=1 Tax=Pseudobythopirellula maris TaxID=2527991 RepID=A0A5C5ZIJ9_9BACT|nr:DNA mismatch repair endonuclease MutL [Pseudobythopirellula maris]TWT86827.1 DNA mismatch repair protein MutL [Pseudobythopirellula maris]
MPVIRPLPTAVVNQIAAGEVVERPASVVKELMENAVDAGATRVDVAIERGGADLVRVSDNGRGVAPDELLLAVTNHATSKIASADELFRVGTLGFRGEALASISAISRFLLRSRQEGAAEGAELAVLGGSVGEVAPAGCPVGTTIEVRDLFFNTPVRQKFLKTPQTEIGHVTETFTRVALAAPSVHFTLSHNGRTLHDLPPCGGQGRQDELTGWRERIAALFGDDLAAGLIEVASDEPLEEQQDSGPAGSVRLSGFVAHPSHSRANNRLQYLLLNGRAIRDRALQHALGEAYRGLMITGRSPICFLRLEMPPHLVDVNVHPTKLEVRFVDSGRLYSQLLGTLRSKFLASDLRSLGQQGAEPRDGDEAAEAAAGEGDLVGWAKSRLSQRRFDGPHGDAPASAGRSGGAAPFKAFPADRTPVGEPLALRRFTPDPDRTGAAMGVAATDPRSEQAAEYATEYTTPSEPLAVAGKAMQLHNRYLVVETESGMEVIDQHALHERVLYEQIRPRALAGGLEKQKLLVPEPVDLTAEEAAAVLENRELLGRLGIDVSPFGGETVLVESCPAMLRRLRPEETLRGLVEKLLASGEAPDGVTERDIVDELLHSMSCKAAVKYGDPLTDEEIAALLAARPGTENHHHCPHGRATSLEFSCDELDRRFDRV